jgi:tetratricopeptide (TPR) repeat protein
MPDIRDNDIILTRVGDSYQFEGAFKAAKVIYNQVVKLFPDTDGGLVARIRLAESPSKDKDHPWDIFQVAPTTDALKTYNEILTKYPTRPVAELAQLKLGVFYYKKGDYPKALAILEQLLQKIRAVRSGPRWNTPWTSPRWRIWRTYERPISP